jgi:glycyl-tRNA synthetase alpha chain
VRLADELQLSVYNFEMADVEKTWKHFDLCEAECKGLLEKYAAFMKDEKPRLVSSENGDVKAEKPVVGDKQRFPLLAAYELCLKCSHLFNILDARGAISVTERVGVIARVRALAVGIAKAWVDQQTETEASAPEEPEPAARKGSSRKSEPLPVG